MPRYIDADMLKQSIRKKYSDLGIRIGVNGIINEQPTADVVEVVRCKDCENWDRHWISSTFTENAHHCVVLNNVFDGEFYCACGHKRRSF